MLWFFPPLCPGPTHIAQSQEEVLQWGFPQPQCSFKYDSLYIVCGAHDRKTFYLGDVEDSYNQTNSCFNNVLAM